ncbi:dCTP deaminase [Shewanella frigidimarina]|uniref:dCTP deaminase n=1 Tax=Shewanella frigidimarina TaxID=56812 RepID=UPI00059DF978|nr:deoxycytidine deaminase [Shewanella frigidimarina]
MIYSPKSLLEEIRKGNIIRNLSERELNAPEGVGFDLRIASLSVIESGSGSLRIDTRRTPSAESILWDSNGYIKLKSNSTYLAVTCEEFELPQDMAALFYPRSTLFRSGVLFQSSVLPSGYIGPMTFALTNTRLEDFEIEQGARFAHTILTSVSGAVNLYKGQWQGGRLVQPFDEEQI